MVGSIVFYKQFSSYGEILKIIPKASSNGPGHMPYANSKGTGQPVHQHSLTSTFVVHRIDSMIYILALSKASRF